MHATQNETTSRSTHDASSAVEISLARSRTDLRQAFELLYQSYLRAGLDRKKPSGVRLTPYHLLPTTEVVVARLRGQVISTVSLVGDGYLGLPMQSMYPAELNQLRIKGLRLAEVGCLADRRESPRRFMDLFIKKTRLMAQVARARGIDALVAATHPKHARFYKRALGFSEFGELRDCPYVEGKPAVALFMEFEQHRGTELYSRYFDNPYPDSELKPYIWDAETRRIFKRILQRDTSIIEAAAAVSGGLTSGVISGVLTSN